MIVLAGLQIRMTFDATTAAASGARAHDILVFVDNLAEQRVEECFRVVLRVE